MTWMKKNLNSYLDSGFLFVPDDFSAFQSGGELEGQCILCAPTESTSHAGHRLIRFANECDLHVCENCAYEVDVRTAMLVSDDPDEIDDEMSKLVDQQINEYLFSGRMPKLVRLSWPMPTHMCGFCGEHVTHVADTYLTVPIPMDTLTPYSGHFVACSRCADKMGWKSLPIEATDMCPECKSSYPITIAEEDARIMANTVGQHMCGECYLKHHRQGSESYFARYVPYACPKCSTDNYLDKTMFQVLPDITSGRMFTHCNHCSKLMKVTVPDYATDYIIVFPEEDSTSSVFIAIYKHADGWSYIVNMIKPGGELERISYEDVFSEAYEAAFVATQRWITILNNKTYELRSKYGINP